MKETFLIKLNYKSIVNKLSDKQAGILFKMLFEYVESGVNAGSTDDKIDMAFEFMKLDLDYFDKKYNNKVNQNRENGKKGGNPNFVKGQRNPYYITEHNRTLPNITEHKLNDNDNDNEGEGDNIPPTLEELKKFIKEKKYFVNAEAFMAYYNSIGWIVGKTPMKSWRAMVMRWEINEYSKKDNGSNGRQTGQQQNVGIHIATETLDYGKSTI